MEKKLWHFAEDLPTEKTPFEVLREFARSLEVDTDYLFSADVAQILQDDGSIICSFYLVVPKLKHYSYKLMQMESKRFDTLYPVAMVLFGKAEVNQVRDTGFNELDFRNKIEAFILNPLTSNILSSLRLQIDIFNEYSRE